MSNCSRGYPVPQIVLLILVAYLFALNLFMIFPTSLSPLKDDEMWLYLISILGRVALDLPKPIEGLKHSAKSDSVVVHIIEESRRTSLPSGLGNECYKGNVDTKLFIDGNTLPCVTKSKSVIQILQLLYCHVFKFGGDICYFLVMCAPWKAIVLVSVSRVDGCSSLSTSNGDLGSSSSDSNSDTSSDGELEGASSILGMALLKNKGIKLYRTESKKSRELCKSITIVSALIVLVQGWFFFNNWYQSLWVIMGTAKFDVEEFTSKNDFRLWRLKMRAFLVQQGLQDALLREKNLLSTMQEKHKIELLEKAHSAIVLSLGDTLLREVAKAKSAAELWLKLESLYMTKSLGNRLHKKIKLYTFKMIPVLDEDKAIMLPTSLDASYTNMKEAIMYERDNMTFDEVQSILHARELQKQEESKEKSGEGLNIRGRYEKREKKGNNSNSRSKSKTKKFKCFICHRERHFKKDCPDRRQNTVKKTMNEGDAAVILDGYDSVEVLNVAEVDSSKEWILDSGCSFHMCPIKTWFENFKEADGGHVLLGNNKHCKILGQTVTSKVSTMLKEDMGTTKLWHQRLGHISHRGLQELEKQGVLGNYKLTNLTFCEHCVFGKTTRVKFAKVVHETQNQLDYIHSDLWEPSRVSSIGGARSPSSALQFKTPQEKWIGKAANYQHLKVFGCTTYVHTKTDKLEPRAVKCIFLGYPKGVKGYKLWIETQGKRKCIISRDVTFNEQDMSKQTPTKYVEGSDQLQFEVEHENLQPKKFKETSSKTVQEEIVHERQDEPTQGLESYSLARDSIAEEIVDMEPKTYQEAINSNEANQWVKAIQEEMDSLRKNETWELVTKPSSIRLLLAFVAHKDLELDQLDVKTTFLHGELDELIYMQPPEGFGEGIKDGQVCLLKKSLYGLKQSPRLWYKRFDKYMLDIGFNRSSHDGCVYFKLTEDNMVYILLYVDDMLVACKEKRHLEQVKEILKAKFEMKDLG
ncbi:Retrovirus-related Pol polyprotein from transposon TNT 1-94 [Vitis vinifera]|uniref:Retrovirus-related Pol polyprotein from transposon TNT 1-94 n=1 Tax=Vitis vinifera TaxID=29760 RepID=A0A438G6T3_VITVI|nr:Retrovirus-related Pol polyprotein from transposon TNT 1-94 [Vitis vinifera]